MNILWLAHAEHDLEELLDFIAHDDPRSALTLFEQIKHTIETLKTFPDLGHAGRVKYTRELVIPDLPYIVPYIIDAQEIRILAIFHTSRKWPDTE